MRLLHGVALALLISGVWACSNSSSKGTASPAFEDAVTYNDFIIQRQGKIINHILAVSNLVGTNLDSAETMLSQGVAITDSALTQVEAMGAFNGDSTFRNRALQNFRFYRRLFTTDYNTIIRINRKGADATEADIDSILEIQQRLESEEAELDKALSNAQTDFAKRNKMPLLENEVQKKIDSIQ